MKVTESLAKEVNVQQACAALAVPRASFYRWQDREEDDREELVIGDGFTLALSSLSDVQGLWQLLFNKFNYVPLGGLHFPAPAMMKVSKKGLTK